jgi:hypothetical protein
MPVFTLTFAYILHLKDGRSQADRVKSDGAVIKTAPTRSTKEDSAFNEPWVFAYWHSNVVACGVVRTCVAKRGRKGVA